MVELNFDTNEYEPLGSFEPLPVGEYTVVIESSEKKPANTGRGEYLQFVYNVIDGDYQGRKIFDRLNIVNESEQAQTIARRALTSICKAVNVTNPRQTEDLHDKPFVVKVGIRPAKGEYGPSNKITEYKSTSGPIAPNQPAAAKSAPKEEKPAESPAPTKKQMPWNKKK